MRIESAACRCRPLHRGEFVDADAMNEAARARMADHRAAPREVDCLIVPGYTPRLSPLHRLRGGLHAKAAARCAVAADDLLAGVAPLAIVSGGTVRGDENEAVLMREALLGRGVAPERIWLEPCARHSTTNLRNAARVMLAFELRVAFVVTSDIPSPPPLRWLALHRYPEQANYFGHPRLSSFDARCRRTLGYTVGALVWVRPFHVRFVPSRACLCESRHPSDEGDP